MHADTEYRLYYCVFYLNLNLQNVNCQLFNL